MNVYVRNLEGTTDDDRSKRWKALWKDKRGELAWPLGCPVQNTLFRKFATGEEWTGKCQDRISGSPAAEKHGVGAHVVKVDEDGNPIDNIAHIMPLCKWHNYPGNQKDPMLVDENLLVPLDQL